MTARISLRPGSKALVTGANGFVGRYVARQLASVGYRVAGLGHGHWGAEDPAAWGISNWRATDVDTESLYEHADKPDLIVHCAGSGSVGFSLDRPREDFRRNVDTTLAVLEFVRLHAPDARVVLPSSAAVYGIVQTTPIGTDAPLLPCSPYGVHKRMAEDLARSYAAYFAVRVVIVRLFSIYGEGLRKQLPWDACRKILAGTPHFGGDGEETRDWIHVEDSAALLAAASVIASTDCPSINGGTGEAITVRAVVERLAHRLGGDMPIFSGEVRAGDPRHFQAEITEASACGWSPTHRLDEGLDAYADWFCKYVAARPLRL